MRISYVLQLFPPISETAIINELTALMDLGHDVRIVSLERTTDKIFHKEVYSRGILSKARFFMESDYGSLFSGDLFYTIFYFFKIIAGNLVAFVRNPRGKFRPNLRIARACAHLRGSRVVHAHFATDSAEIAMKVSRVLSIPYTLTVHAYDIFKREYAESPSLKEKLFSAEKIITISDYNKKYLCERFGIRPEKIKVIHVGVSKKRFGKADTAKSGNKIITVARLVEKKGLEDLIESLKILKDSRIDFSLTIVGKGPLKEGLSSSIKDAGLSDRVSFRAELDDDELDGLLREASLFVLPCIKTDDDDLDGTPMALMEAMASGLPVVSTDVSGIPEVVEDGVTGILVPQKKPSEFAAAMKKILEDSSMAKVMGAAGRKKIFSEFDAKDSASRLVSVWESIT